MLKQVGVYIIAVAPRFLFCIFRQGTARLHGPLAGRLRPVSNARVVSRLFFRNTNKTTIWCPRADMAIRGRYYFVHGHMCTSPVCFFRRFSFTVTQRDTQIRGWGMGGKAQHYTAYKILYRHSTDMCKPSLACPMTASKLGRGRRLRQRVRL